MNSTKRIPLVLIMMILAALVFAAQAKADDFPEEIIMAPPEGVKHTKAPVLFPHAVHDKSVVQCNTCHHTLSAEKGVKACDSAGCHDNYASRTGEHAYYPAFHSKAENSCTGCHKAARKNGRDAPTKCSACHPK